MKDMFTILIESIDSTMDLMTDSSIGTMEGNEQIRTELLKLRELMRDCHENGLITVDQRSKIISILEQNGFITERAAGQEPEKQKTSVFEIVQELLRDTRDSRSDESICNKGIRTLRELTRLNKITRLLFLNNYITDKQHRGLITEIERIEQLEKDC